MKRILIFSGTTEGRTFAKILADEGIASVVCVATEYGELVMQEENHAKIQIHTGRMEEKEMEAFLQQEEFEAVVDATHPYAIVVSENIKKAVESYCKESGRKLSYYRLNREEQDKKELFKNIVEFKNIEQCASYLNERAGNILLTTGSKELGKFVDALQEKERIYARVLPGMESIRLCEDAGIAGKQIIAMQGPFSKELNLALLHQFRIAYLVTKESGRTGGLQEKLEAAEQAGITVCMIARPKQQQGYRLAELAEKFTGKYDLSGKSEEAREVALVGIGMGNAKTITREAEEAIASADILFGAKRMLEAVKGKKKPTKAIYRAEEILQCLKEQKEIKKAAVLFSGDLGFYSGAEKLRHALEADGTFQIKSYPGISSVAYFAAKLGVSYQDAVLSSIHGRAANVALTVARNEKSFFLLSGRADVRHFVDMLLHFFAEKVSALTVSVGYQLSYPEEKILTAGADKILDYIQSGCTQSECIHSDCAQKEQTGEGLYLVFVRNPLAGSYSLTHGFHDEVFSRDKVPMTKEEVREVSICKLHIGQHAVFYDIGSGTGSISVEVAGLSDTIAVHAFEQKEEAVALLQKNSEKFGLSNITIHHTKAPDGMEKLEAPTHVFIGGSGGNLMEIIKKVAEKNASARVVINAISLETLAELTELERQIPLHDMEVLQLQVSRAKKAGRYHLMQGENPIYIVSFTLGE